MFFCILYLSVFLNLFLDAISKMFFSTEVFASKIFSSKIFDPLQKIFVPEINFFVFQTSSGWKLSFRTVYSQPILKKMTLKKHFNKDQF